MKRLEFDCPFDLVDKIETLLNETDNHYPLISVYGKYDIVKTILEELIMDGFSIANEIQLEDCEISNYDKEFVLYLKPDGINVEKIFVDGGYCYGRDDISFVHEDCSSTLLKYIGSIKVYEFGYIGEEFECDDCDGKCDCERKEKDEKPITTTSKEVYKVNGERVDKETFEKKYSEFEDRYMDNIRDMLLKYSSFMDEWNDLLKMFY